jgi:hypothetical protein
MINNLFASAAAQGHYCVLNATRSKILTKLMILVGSE